MDREDLKKIAAGVTLAVPEGDKSALPIIKVIGVGGGGCNAISHMYSQGDTDVTFVVCNTDRQALLSSPVPTKVQIGDGLGAGADPELGRKYAEEDADKIAALFDDDTKMVFITAGMGGGTGTGAAPVVARIAKERGLLTIGIVTIPFLFEGRKKILKAFDGADEMAKYVDALLIINNERITDIYADLDFINAFNKADDTLSTAARSISEIITCEGYINLDFKDVNTTLRDGGTAIISTGYGEGENRVTKAIEDALNSPLLRNREIGGSKHLLFNLYFSRTAETPFRMAEAAEITSFVNNVDDSVDVIWGVGFDDSLGDKVKMTILASGFNNDFRKDEGPAPLPRQAKKAEPEQAQPKPAQAPRLSTPGIGRNAERNIAAATQRPAQQPAPEQEQAPAGRQQSNGISEADAQRIGREYGEERLEDMRSNADRSRYVVLSPSQLEDIQLIERLERTPAYNRDKRVSDEIKNINREASPSRDGSANNNAGGNIISFN